MIHKLTKLIIIVFLFFTMIVKLQAQVATYELEIKNDKQISPTEYIFDIYIKNTSTGTYSDANGGWQLSTFQYGIKFNYLMETGGTLTPTFVAGYSDLADQQPVSIQLGSSGATRGIRVAAVAKAFGAGQMIVGTKRVCRVKLTKSIPFDAGGQFNFTWENVSTSAPYKTYGYGFTPGPTTTLITTGPVNPYPWHITTNLNNPILNATYTGSTSSDPTVATNWNPSTAAPLPTQYVIIPANLTNYPTYTAAKTLVGVYIKSDGTGTGSLIGGENLTLSSDTMVKTTMERYISAYTSALPGSADGWHFISSPILSSSLTMSKIASSTFAPNTMSDLYRFAETVVALPWLNYKFTNFAHTTFNTGVGYLCAYDITAVRSFVGSAFNGNDISGLNLTNSAFNGWNLIGNPYPSAITYGGTTWDANLSGVAKIVNSGGSYTDIPTGGYIPATNGFFVHTNAAISLTIPKSARVHNATPFYKSTNANELLKLTVYTQALSYQEAVIKVEQNATANFDDQYDGEFYAGMSADVPNFYSVINGGKKLSTNALPAFTDGLVVQLSFEPKNGIFDIVAEGLNSINRTVTIRDKKLITTQLLSNANSVYSFTSAVGDAADRFEISFGAALGVNENETPQTNIEAWIYEGTLYLNNSQNDSKLEIFDISGRLLQTTLLNGTASVNFNYPIGVYTLRLTNKQSIQTMKVINK